MAKYEDTPLTNFPDAEDNWARMNDLTASLFPLASQYNQLWDTGKINEANALLDANPDLKNAIFNADKWNKIRDAIIAIQRYYLEDVEKMIEHVAQNTVGINDNPDEQNKPLVAYSAKKTEELIKETIKNFEKIVLVKFTADGWIGSDAPYTQTVNVEEISNENSPTMVKYWDGVYNKDDIKAYNKAFGILADGRGETGNQTVTWTCSKKPSIDITVGLKGLKAFIGEENFTRADFLNMKFGTLPPTNEKLYGQVDRQEKMTSYENLENNVFVGDLTILENNDNKANTLFIGKVNNGKDMTQNG